MSGIKDDSWVPEKKAELAKIIAACLGLHVEASTTNETVTPGQTVTIKLEAINRCDIPVTLQEARCSLTGDSMKIDAALPPKRTRNEGSVLQDPGEHSLFPALLAS
jgi:hypothetical protein